MCFVDDNWIYSRAKHVDLDWFKWSSCPYVTKTLYPSSLVSFFSLIPCRRSKKQKEKSSSINPQSAVVRLFSLVAGEQSSKMVTISISVTPDFIAYVYVLYHFQSPSQGLEKICKSDAFWWFVSAKCIFMAVKIVQMTPWKKMEWHAEKAMFVAHIFELIAVRQMCLFLLSRYFWVRLFLNCLFILLFGLALLDQVLGATTEVVDNNAVNNRMPVLLELDQLLDEDAGR